MPSLLARFLKCSKKTTFFSVNTTSPQVSVLAYFWI